MHSTALKLNKTVNDNQPVTKKAGIRLIISAFGIVFG